MADVQLLIPDQELAKAAYEVCRLIATAGGQALIVGGSVRDALLGMPTTDIDIESYGIEPMQLQALLASRFDIDLVGKSFGVFKLRHLEIDIALPRREAKAGQGHKAFEVLSDPSMPFAEAAARRDFTINALGYDPLTGRLFDAHGGVRDLEARVLRHTSPRFAEDSLRVLRGVQFAARFDFTVAPETVELCRSIGGEDLPRERQFEEWRKLLVLGVKPSRGLAFLRDCGWVRYYPELEALIGCEQDPEWHPEGDVWTHTLHCLDAFAEERSGDPWEDLVVGFGVLCHDFGKPATTVSEQGRIRSEGHEPAGEAPTRRFLHRLTDHRELIEQVLPLVRSHLCPLQLYQSRAGDAAIRRLARRVGRIDRLVRVARADQRGRPPFSLASFPEGDWLLERAQALEVQDRAPKPIILGRHLIALGVVPGPGMGRLLAACFEAQLDGVFHSLDEGLRYARHLLEAETEQP